MGAGALHCNPAHTRFPSQSLRLEHAAPVLPRRTQLPQLDPAVMRQYPEPHWES